MTTDTSDRPEYGGERGSRTNNRDKLYCQRCDRLATHTAVRHDLDGEHANPIPVQLCEMHLQQQAQISDLRKCKELPEFKRYKKKLRAWRAAQEMPGQESWDFE